MKRSYLILPALAAMLTTSAAMADFQFKINQPVENTASPSLLMAIVGDARMKNPVEFSITVKYYFKNGTTKITPKRSEISRPTPNSKYSFSVTTPIAPAVKIGMDKVELILDGFVTCNMSAAIVSGQSVNKVMTVAKSGDTYSCKISTQ